MYPSAAQDARSDLLTTTGNAGSVCFHHEVELPMSASSTDLALSLPCFISSLGSDLPMPWTFFCAMHDLRQHSCCSEETDKGLAHSSQQQNQHTFCGPSHRHSVSVSSEQAASWRECMGVLTMTPSQSSAPMAKYTSSVAGCSRANA